MAPTIEAINSSENKDNMNKIYDDKSRRDENESKNQEISISDDCLNDNTDDAYYKRVEKRNNDNHYNNNNNNGSINHRYHDDDIDGSKVIVQNWIKFTNFLRTVLTKFVVSLAVSAATYPKTYLLSLTVLSFLSIGIGFKTNFALESDMGNIYAPANSRSKQHLEWINDKNASGFKSNHPLLLYIHKDGDNIMDTTPIQSSTAYSNINFFDNDHSNEDPNNLVQVIRAAFDAIDVVRNAPGYQQLCQLNDSNIDNTSNIDSNNNNNYNNMDCPISSITRIWDNNRNFFENEVTFYNALKLAQKDGDKNDHSADDYDWLMRKVSSDTHNDGTPMFHETIIGKGVWDEQDNANPKEGTKRTLISAKSLLVIIQFPVVLNYKDQLKELEYNVIDGLEIMRNEWLLSNDNNGNANGGQNQHPKLEFSAEASWERDAMRAFRKDIPLIGIVVTVMTSFACLLFYNPNDKVESRCLIGLASVFTICMSIMFAFGIMFIIGVPCTQIALLIPFIVFGVGLDDTFIITGEFYRLTSQEKCNNDADVVEKVRLTMEEVGISISLTTSTTVTAFLLGMSTSSLPGVIWGCYYAALTIMTDFIYQITYFVAFMVLNERRVRRNQRDCCFWITVLDKNEHENETINEKDRESIKNENMDYFQNDHDGDQNKKINKQQYVPILERIMTWYAKVLLKPMTKNIVLLLFTLLTAACSYSVTQFKQEFNYLTFLPDDSYLHDFIYAVEEYSDRKRTFDVYFRNIDQSDPLIQEQMMDYIDDYTNNLKQLGGQPPALCWFRDIQLILGKSSNNMTLNDMDRFAKYAALLPSSDGDNDNLSSSYISVLNSMTTNQQLDVLFTNPNFRELYESDIVIRDQEIVSSRCKFIIRDLDLEEVANQIQYMKDQRVITQSQPLNQLLDEEWPMFGYTSSYVFWEFFLVVIREFFFTIVTGVVSVTAIAFVLIPHRAVILFALPLIIVLYINFLGSIRLFGLQINGFTYIVVVISVGLLVDYLMHILMKYFEIQQQRKQQRQLNRQLHPHHGCLLITTRDECVTKILKSMGSSILEGGLTTFLAVLPLLLSTASMFKQSFAAFFSLVVIGIIHGLVLLPVILSIYGPFETYQNDDRNDDDKEIIKTKIHPKGP